MCCKYEENISSVLGEDQKELLGKDLAKEVDSPFMTVSRTCSKIGYKYCQKLLSYEGMNDAQVQIFGKQLY